MTTIDYMSALEAAMDQEAIAREIAALEARMQNRQGSSPREMQGMQARLTALREDLRAASDGPLQQQQQQPSVASYLQQPSAVSNLQQPSAAANYLQQSSAVSNLQQSRAAANLQQPSAASNLQQPSAASNLQQPSAALNLQQPSAAANLQQPSAAANLQPNNGTQQRQRPPIPEDLDRSRMIQQQLILILHANNCQRREIQVNRDQRQCRLPHCRAMRNILTHMSTCRAGRNCTVSHCSSTRQILGHWKNCTCVHCPVCSTFKQAEPNWYSSIRAAATQADSEPSHILQNIRREYRFLGIPVPQLTVREHLVLYLHAHDCQRRESVANGAEVCRFPRCKIMKALLRHRPTCRFLDCPIPLCSANRQIVSHWNNCGQGDCPVCAPLMQLNRDYRLMDEIAADNIVMDLEQLIDASNMPTLSPNWPVASPSPTNTVNAAGTAAPAGGHHSLSAMITAVSDMQKRLFGSVPWWEIMPPREDPKAVDGRSASPHSPFAFKTDDIVPIPSRFNLAWHRDVPSELRKHLIKRLIQTLISTSELPTILDRHAYHMMLYSKNVESNFFDAAESQSKYYHLLAEKIFRLQIEFAEKGQKPKERVAKTGRPLQTGTAAVPGPSTLPVQVNTQPNSAQVDSMPRQLQRPRQTASTRVNPLQTPQRRRQSPGVQVAPVPDQPQTLSLQVNSLLAPDQQQQLQQWYTKQRLLLFDRQLMEQTGPSSSGYHANDFS